MLYARCFFQAEAIAARCVRPSATSQLSGIAVFGRSEVGRNEPAGAGWLDGATAWACPLSEIESCFGCGSVLRCDEKPEHAEVSSFSIVDG